MGRFVAFCRNFFRLVGRGFLLADTHHGIITSLATVILAILTIFYVVYAKHQWNEMRNARRPWVGISEKLTLKRPPSFTVVAPAITGLNGEKEFIVTKFELSGNLQNFGSSPARKVYELLSVIDSPSIRYDFREIACKTVERQSAGQNPFSEFTDYFIRQPAKAIFPNVAVPIEPSVITFGMFVDKTPQMPNPLWVVGCVAYQDSFGDVHHTEVLYRSSVPEGARQETAIETPMFTYAPFTEFVMEDSDGD